MFVVQGKELGNLDLEEAIVARYANVAQWNHTNNVGEYKTVVLILLTKLLPVWQEPGAIKIQIQTHLRDCNEKAQKAEEYPGDDIDNRYHVHFPEVLKPVAKLVKKIFVVEVRSFRFVVYGTGSAQLVLFN